MINLQQVKRDWSNVNYMFGNEQLEGSASVRIMQEMWKKQLEFQERLFIKSVNSDIINFDISYYTPDFLPRKLHIKSVHVDSKIPKRRFRRNKSLFLKRILLKDSYPINIAWDIAAGECAKDISLCLFHSGMKI